MSLLRSSATATLHCYTLPCVASGHRTSQLVVEAAVLPPQLREATQPAPPAYHTYECGSSLPGEAVGHPHRRANARAMRRSCASHRGGGGVVEAWRSHQTTRKRVPRQRVATRKTRNRPELYPMVFSNLQRHISRYVITLRLGLGGCRPEICKYWGIYWD